MIGHRYSNRALLAAHSEAEEQSLWMATVALEEAAVIANELAPQFPDEVAARLRAQGERRRGQAAQIRTILENHEPFRAE